MCVAWQYLSVRGVNEVRRDTSCEASPCDFDFGENPTPARRRKHAGSTLSILRPHPPPPPTKTMVAAERAHAVFFSVLSVHRY